ncbi:MAE_28990/MAE_18760 family HEPN-like nuclease [Aliarcobacter skirrowii]|uniref:MAE_28990/MAE_18760 family HEPN-like nuclease n=1 Tax=Aliarcobacter TaxID=2321111 RepID=UPI0029BBDC99|nr:MAE_28990/MAE_18760 family HEPN-like nuclease [Aliarcobacter skirrowii]MDX4061710.1 MAE_28990/MAE_18760 family HEPN-like nuclease [Aliarcobacter skirrowii]
MVNTKTDFNQRKKEIEDYFSFLDILDKETTFLKYMKDTQYVEEEISKDIQRILIANSFLILYNLIEATIRNSIVEIYEKIQEDGITYNDLSQNLKKIWIKNKTKNLKEGNFNVNTLQTNVESIINNVIDNEIVLLTKDDIDISGNIDAEKIRTLAKEIGFDKTSNGSNLVTIKNKRNGLAHGNFTFYDVGKDFTVGDIQSFKSETFSYLQDVITNIEKFINEKKYQL